MSQFREQTRRLLGDENLPETLSVIHSPRVEAFSPLNSSKGLTLGEHYDWILAAGSGVLALVQLRGPRLRQRDLVFAHPFERVWFRFEDHGDEVRARDLTIVADDGRWFVVSAHMTRSRAKSVSQFTKLLIARTATTDLATFL